MDADLVDYKQTIKVLEPNDQYEQITYSIADPVLKRANKQVRVLTQSGYAVGWLKKYAAPAPLFPGTLLGPRDVQIEDLDGVTFKTTWSYVMAIDDAQALDYAAWQATPDSLPELA